MFACLLLLCSGWEPEPCRQFPLAPQTAFEGYRLSMQRLAFVRENHLPDYIGRMQLKDAEFRFQCWDVLDNIKRVYTNHPELRAQNAARLRCLLGDEDFQEGRMPTPLPHSEK